MCLVTFMKDGHPDYPLILVANREERYSRPAVAIHRWADEPKVTAGLDLQEKGTWLGYTDDGKFIAILNDPFTAWQPKTATPRSRGQLLRDYLTKDASLAAFEKYLEETRFDYKGYHLLYGTVVELRYYSNVKNQFRTFSAGIHCLANTEDDLGKHRKNRSTALLMQYVAAHKKNLQLAELTDLMQDQVKAAALTTYPEALAYETAREHSAVFIQGAEFGTVGTTALLVTKDGQICVREVKYDQKGATEITTKEQPLHLK